MSTAAETPHAVHITGLNKVFNAGKANAVEALVDAGVAAGLPRAVATDLAVQTMAGSAAMASDSFTEMSTQTRVGPSSPPTP